MSEKVEVGIIRANYGHKGDFAIVKGTLKVLQQVGIHARAFIDPDIDLPKSLYSDISTYRTWASAGTSGRLISFKGLVFQLINFRLFATLPFI